MPNINALKAAENRRNEEATALSHKAKQRLDVRVELERYQKMSTLFGQEAWQIVRETFMAQHAEEMQVLLDEGQELSDTQLRTLRYQLQMSERIIGLDEWVAGRVDSLQKKLSTAQHEADGSQVAAR